MSKKYDTSEILIRIHAPDVKVRAVDWDESEYVSYHPENGVIDEKGNSVNASVFVLNYEWEILND
jgi:hypothetical protein